MDPSTFIFGRKLAPKASSPRRGRWSAKSGESEVAMATNPDFRDLFSALFAEGAEYLLVGAHAVMLYTTPRYTKDLDIWVRPSVDNAARVYRALVAFGAPMADLTLEDLAVSGTIFQIGVEPNRIDVVTSVDGLEFEDLLKNKRAVARPQDLLDVERLERAQKDKP
jgi:hypothetical protein